MTQPTALLPCPARKCRGSVGLVLFALFASGALAQNEPARETITVVPPAAQRAFDAAMQADNDVLVAQNAAMRAYSPLRCFTSIRRA